jgi:hypothetical protein
MDNFEAGKLEQQLKKTKTVANSNEQEVLDISETRISNEEITTNILKMPLEKLSVSELIALQHNFTIMMSKITTELGSRLNSP